MTDKNKPQPIEDDGVDMDRIEEMMGPIPGPHEPRPEPSKDNNKGKDKSKDKADTAPAEPKRIKISVGDSLKEFNESLKAKMPGLGEAAIERVDDNDDSGLTELTPSGDDQAESTPVAAAGAPIISAEAGATDDAAAMPVEPEKMDGPEASEAPEAAEESDISEPEDSKTPDMPAEPTAPPEVTEPVEELVRKPKKGDIDAAKKAFDPVTPKAKSDDIEKIDDPGLDKAVDDIVASETDRLLAMEDEKNAQMMGTVKTKKPGSGPTLRDRLLAIWQRAGTKWALVYITLIALAVIIVLPFTRYFILNTAGVRVRSSVMVLDEKTGQPLKNVRVSLAGKSATTDGQGKVELTGLKQGATQLVIDKSAYAEFRQKRTLGWGSNPMGEQKLTPVGNQYTFVTVDFLSGKPVTGTEAVSGEGNAKANKEGKLVLALDNKDDSGNVTVTITAAGYRDEKVTFPVTNKLAQTVKMVPSRKDVFISKRSGKYDVYKIDIDGKNSEKIVNGTGLERDDVALVPNPTEPMAAMVATRENVRNPDGFLLSTLYEVDVKTGELTKIDQSERIQIIGWTADQRLVYVKVAAGSSAANAKRQRLISYNAKTNGDVKELATGNSFNDVLMIDDKVYFAPAAAFQPAASIGFFRVNADGSNRRTLLDKEVWNIFRTSYDELSLSVQQNWYTHKLKTDDVTKVSTPPSALKSRLYVVSPDKNRALWVDSRDGKGVLLRYNVESKKEDTVLSRSGLKNPVVWATGTHIIFRLNDGTETADYAVSTEGGEPKKISDVTDSGGVDTWYYY